MIARATLCLLVILATGCLEAQDNSEATGQDETPTLPRSFKGYELYSWQDKAGSWHYALLSGTNRIKTAEEVVTAAENTANDGLIVQRAVGTDDLLALLRRMPENDFLTWLTEPDPTPATNDATVVFALPGTEVLDQVRTVCNEHKLECNLPE